MDPLFRAVHDGDVQKAREALQKECDCEAPCGSLMFKGRRLEACAIHVAAWSTNATVEMLKVLVEYRADVKTIAYAQSAAVPRSKIASGATRREVQAIHLAASRGDADKLRFLVQNGANPKEPALLNGEFHYAPIHDAVWFNRLESLRVLLELGALVNVANCDQCTALHLAARVAKPELVAFLLESKAAVDALDKWNRSPLQVALEDYSSESTAICKLLLEQGANITADVVAKQLMSENPSLPETMRALCKQSQPLDNVRGAQGTFIGLAPRTLQSEENSDYASNELLSCLLPQDKPLWSSLSDPYMTYAQVVVSRCVVPGICSPEILRALARTPNQKLLSTHIVHAIIEEMWDEVWPYYLLDIAWNAVTLVVTCLATAHLRWYGRVAMAVLACLFVLHAARLLAELLQIVVSFWRGKFWSYVCCTENLVDWMHTGINLAGFAAMSNFSETLVRLSLISVFCAAAWFRCVYSLRCSSRFGPRLLPIKEAVRDTLTFIVILIFSLGAVIHAYYVTGVRDVPNQFYGALLPIVRLGLFGDFDLHELEGVDTIYRSRDDQTGSMLIEGEDPLPSARYVLVQGIFWATGVLVTVVLMNLLIGILGANYDLYEDRSWELFLRERAAWTCNFHDRRNVLLAGLRCCRRSCGCRCFGRRGVAPQPTARPPITVQPCDAGSEDDDYGEGDRVSDSSGKHLWMAFRADDEAEHLRSLRSALSQKLEQVERKLDQTMRTKFEGLEGRITGLEEHLRELLLLAKSGSPQPTSVAVRPRAEIDSGSPAT